LFPVCKQEGISGRKEGSILTVEVPKTPVPLVYGLVFYLFNAYWVSLVFHPVVASPIYV
jgi:hypothetical protein